MLRCRGLRARPRDFWAILQETGADFAMGSELLGGFRRELFAIGSADLGKRRRVAVFQADSACETTQKFAGDLGNRIALLPQLAYWIRVSFYRLVHEVSGRQMSRALLWAISSVRQVRAVLKPSLRAGRLASVRVCHWSGAAVAATGFGRRRTAARRAYSLPRRGSTRTSAKQSESSRRLQFPAVCRKGSTVDVG